jgi:hypothetical protein
LKAIRVTYRALFQQPQGALNPLGMRFSAHVAVEVFGAGDKWQAREITGHIFTRLGKFASSEYAKREVVAAFETQLQPWQMWGTVPSDGKTALAVERMLIPGEEIVHCGGDKWGWREPEDFTHIMNGKTQGNARIPPTACGLTLPAKCFINNLANVEPTCRGCAEIWEREYKNK